MDPKKQKILLASKGFHKENKKHKNKQPPKKGTTPFQKNQTNKK